jgi:hypothetical protein
MWRWLYAWLTGGKLVELYDPNYAQPGYTKTAARTEHWHKSVAHKLADNRMVAWVYWYSRVGGVVLLPDGVIAPESASDYIKRWREG